MQKAAVLKIAGMTCDSCADRIRLALEKKAGVIATEVSSEHGKAAVRFDSSQTTIDEILLSGVFNKDLTSKWNNGRTMTHRYSAVLLTEPRLRRPV